TRDLDAAQAFLDTDDLDRAKQSLDWAATSLATAPPRDKERHTQLTSVLGTRMAIDRAMPAAPDPTAASYMFGRDGRHAWLYGSPLGALPQPFIARQRFKALSDLSTRSTAAGQTEAAADQASEAFKTAVDGVNHFTGAADLIRLEGIRVP